MVKSVALELTTRCRLACPKCERTIMRETEGLKNHDLPLSIVEMYAKSNIDKFIISGSYGDPIYHPKFLEAIKLLKDHNKIVWISTNGSGKTTEWWRMLFSMLKVEDQISFAIDGYKETVGGYRVNFTEDDFNQAIEVLEIGSKEYDVRIRWQFIPFSFNEHQIEQARELAHSKNIHFMLKKSVRWDGLDDPMMPKDKNLVAKYYLDNHEFIDQ